MGLFGKLLGAGRVVDSPELIAAIERAVDRVEPRLRQAGGYPERYRPAVAHALAYARGLAGQVPGPVRISRAAYVSDPLVRALFATPDEVRAALCVSQSMREFRRDHPDSGEVYALICMRRGSKEVLGIELDGEVLRRDVPQKAIYFTDHTLADPGRSEAEAREHVAQGLFDSLVEHVRLRVEARKQERAEQERERDELLARLHGAGPARRGELETRLQHTLQRLGRLAESLDLRQYGKDFEAVLLAPERHVYIERTEMVLDDMGLLREPGSDGSTRIEFRDLVGRDRRRWTVALMYCERVHEEGEIGDRLVMAQRWLGL
jgi:hypothetical protein